MTYRLDRLADGSTKRISSTVDIKEVERLHADSLARELDILINKQRREVHVIASSFCSRVRCNISGEQLVSFLILGEPYYPDHDSDTDSLDVSALRKRILEDQQEKGND